MAKPWVWLDLCSGLGGASQPAVDRGWWVIRVDIDPRFKPGIVADVRSLPLRPFEIDVLWASPPCQEYSKRALPWFKGLPDPPTDIVEALQRVIARLKPRYWVIENVRGARKWLTPLLGRVLVNTTGHVLWGNVPCLFPNIKPHKGSLGRVNGSGTFMPLRNRTYNASKRRYVVDWPHGNSIIPHHKDASAEAAKVPYEIGKAICLAVEGNYGNR